MAVTKKQIEVKEKHGRDREFWGTTRVGTEKDGRKCGLTERDEEIIKIMHKAGMAVRAIAREYEDKCSRRTITFILYPERRKVVADQFKERRKDGRYYDKDKHRAYMQKHRAKLKAINEGTYAE